MDERFVRGASGMTRKGPDEPVDAGSIVLSGDFLIETCAWKQRRPEQRSWPGPP